MTFSTSCFKVSVHSYLKYIDNFATQEFDDKESIYGQWTSRHIIPEKVRVLVKHPKRNTLHSRLASIANSRNSK